MRKNSSSQDRGQWVSGRSLTTQELSALFETLKTAQRRGPNTYPYGSVIGIRAGEEKTLYGNSKAGLSRNSCRLCENTIPKNFESIDFSSSLNVEVKLR